MKSPYDPTPEDPIDSVLGRYARQSVPPPDPWFAGKVLRRVRAGQYTAKRQAGEASPPVGALDLFLSRAGFAFLAAVAAAGLWTLTGPTGIDSSLADEATGEKEIVEQLDVLIADVQSSFWQEADPLF